MGFHDLSRLTGGNNLTTGVGVERRFKVHESNAVARVRRTHTSGGTHLYIFDARRRLVYGLTIFAQPLDMKFDGLPN